MRKAEATNTTHLPVTRRAVEAQIDHLIDLLDSLDPDPDAEPSLGFTDDSYNPTQVGPNFAANGNCGDDREDDDEREPDVDGEASLGWTSQINQASPHWQANHLGTVDLEQGVGAVRKPRPASKTGGRIMVGAEVFR